MLSVLLIAKPAQVPLLINAHLVSMNSIEYWLEVCAFVMNTITNNLKLDKQVLNARRSMKTSVIVVIFTSQIPINAFSSAGME